MGEAYTAMAFSPMRKIITARMAQATQTIPHFRLAADIEVDALGLRKDLRGQNPDAALSLNDFPIKACAAVLMDTPAVNIQWAGQSTGITRPISRW